MKSLLNTTISNELARRFDEYMIKDKRTRPAIIEEALTEYLEKRNGKTKKDESSKKGN